MKQIAIYGKGGIGKSTIVANVGAALATMGAKVLVVGCDPKADTIRTLIDGRRAKTVLDSLREAQREGIELDVDRIVTRGYRGIQCVESGGPEPGVGCAGRGIISAMEILQQSSLFEANDLDVVLYDVLGDVVCGGFAMPIRMGLARQIYAVTSGEFMAVYAANNICRGILRYATSGGGRFSGLICNARNVANEAQYIQDFADQLEVRLACTIPRDGVVQDAEAHGKTVVEYAPGSALAARFGQLARMMLENEEAVVPKPLSEEDLESLFLQYR